MREGDATLIADMCHNDTAMSGDVRYITHNANDLPHDAGITVSDSGRSFKASVPQFLLRQYRTIILRPPLSSVAPTNYSYLAFKIT